MFAKVKKNLSHSHIMKNLNFSGKIAQFFLYNQALSILVLVGIVVTGIFGYVATPKQYNPDVTLPAFAVQTQYAGATAKEVENIVTREMEEKMAEIPGVDKISSISLDGGMSIVRVEFFVGEDLETSKIKVFSKVFENMDFLNGNNISRPLIKNINPDNVAVGVFSLTAKNSSEISQNELRKKAIILSHIFQEISGVANIEISGGEKKSLTITVDSEKLKNRNLTIGDIKNAIQGNNGRALVGNIKNGNTQNQIEIDAEVLDAEHAKKILIGNGITLGEVATIKDGYLEKISHTSFYSRNAEKISDAVFISLAKRKGINTDFVITQAKEKFQKFLNSEEGKGISGEIVRNNAKIANDAISGLGTNLIQSIVIVSLVLYLFLGARSAFLVAIAIPTTLLFVFFIGYISGQTINKITLFALILSLGLLVDSATVVVENINTHLQENVKNNTNNSPENDNKNIKDIIIVSVNEVGIGLFLSTLTSVIVFLPMTQISGMMGPYMGPLAFFVPAALILALVIAYVITPFLSYLVFKNSEKKHNNKDDKRTDAIRPYEKFLNFLSNISLSHFLEITQKKYATLIRKILENTKTQKIILIGAFGSLFLVFSFIVFELVHFQMLPKSDNKSFWVTLDFPEGTDEPVTQRLAKKITSEISEKTPDVENIQIFSGTTPVVDFNGLFRGFSQRRGSHQASLFISLSDDRKFSSEKNAEYIRKLIQNIQKNTEGNANLHSLQSKQFVFRVVENPPGPPVQATFVAKIKGENYEAQNIVLQKLTKIVENTEGVVDIDSSQENPYPRTVFTIDSEKAKQKGVINKDIYDALSLSFAPQKIGEFHPENSDETSFIELKTENSNRDEISDFSKIFIRNRTGDMIPLSSVIRTEEKTSRPTLFRDEQISTQYLTGEMQNRSIVYAIKDIIFAIFDSENSGLQVESFSLYGIDVSIPKKDSDFDSAQSPRETVTIEWGGEFEMTLDNFRDLGVAMIIAFILVYAILVGQFSSFMVPLLIMATVPLAMLGILPGFAVLDALYGIPLTATALIGFIALMGIVVNNAIIYLEYLNILLERGMKIIDALVEAGEKRLAPIFLTSLTTVLGSLTIAGDPVWSGLAWSIVFGLSLSTLLTLGIFPILYLRSQGTK